MAEPQTTEADGALCHSLRTLDIGDAHVVILRDGVNEIDIPCKDRGRLERHSHFFRALFEFRDREVCTIDLRGKKLLLMQSLLNRRPSRIMLSS